MFLDVSLFVVYASCWDFYPYHKEFAKDSNKK
jgi:hypothetical protein